MLVRFLLTLAIQMPYRGPDHYYCVQVANVNLMNLLPTPGAISA